MSYAAARAMRAASCFTRKTRHAAPQPGLLPLLLPLSLLLRRRCHDACHVPRSACVCARADYAAAIEPLLIALRRRCCYYATSRQFSLRLRHYFVYAPLPLRCLMMLFAAHDAAVVSPPYGALAAMPLMSERWQNAGCIRFSLMMP